MSTYSQQSPAPSYHTEFGGQEFHLANIRDFHLTYPRANYRSARVWPPNVSGSGQNAYLAPYSPNARSALNGADGHEGIQATPPSNDTPPEWVMVSENPSDAELPRPRSISLSHNESELQMNIQGQPPQPDPEEDVLARLHRFYYKLYSKSYGGPMASMHPFDPSRPELSFFYAEHVGPPCLWQQVLEHICVRERLESSNVKFFYRQQVLDEAVPLFSAFAWQGGRCGSLENPLQFQARLRDAETRGQNEAPVFTGYIEDTRGLIGEKLERMVWSKNIVFFAERNAIANDQSVHYRLYWPNGSVPLSSRAPLYRSDPSLSRLSDENVSPPRLTAQYKDHIAHIETIHPSRLKLYRLATQPIPRSIFGGTIEVPKDASLLSTFGAERAFTEEDPLLVCVDVGMLRQTGEPDREAASLPLPIGTRISRRMSLTRKTGSDGGMARLSRLW